VIALAVGLAHAVDGASLPDQVVSIEVLTEPRDWSPGLVAVLHRPAGDERVALAPDPGRQGFSVASSTGAPVRFLDVELVVTADAEPTTAWRRVVPIPDLDHATISILLDEDGLQATRAAWIPWAGAAADAGTSVTLAVAYGWGVLCFGYVGWLAYAARR
jgi:phage baseplate assembly protein gpV